MKQTRIVQTRNMTPYSRKNNNQTTANHARQNAILDKIALLTILAEFANRGKTITAKTIPYTAAHTCIWEYPHLWVFKVDIVLQCPPSGEAHHAIFST